MKISIGWLWAFIFLCISMPVVDYIQNTSMERGAETIYNLSSFLYIFFPYFGYYLGKSLSRKGND